jgi:hypothetical protein
MPNLNFLVDHVGASHMAYCLIEQGNSISEHGDANVTVFYDQLHRPCRRLLIPAMMMIEAWAQPGISVATSLSTVSRLLKFPGASQKMFYVWDMTWLKNPKYVGTYSSIFRNPELTLIARCDDHRDAICDVFNTEVPYVFDNFNRSGWLEILNDDTKTTK